MAAENSLTTAFVTIFGGIIVLVIGQLIIKYILEPIQKHQEILQEIAYTILFHTELWGNPGINYQKDRREVTNKFRGLAAKLATTAKIPLINQFLVNRKIVLSDDNITEVKEKLIAISNSIFAEDKDSSNRKSEKNLENIHTIEKILRVKTITGVDEKEINEVLKTAELTAKLTIAKLFKE